MESCDKITKLFSSSEKKPESRQNGSKEPELDIEEKILRRREMAHLFQWYYPEGGWGWVILVCAFISQSLAHGLQLGFAYPLGVAIRRRFYLPTAEEPVVASNQTNHDRISFTIRSDYSGHENDQRHIEASHIGKKNCCFRILVFYWLLLSGTSLGKLPWSFSNQICTCTVCPRGTAKYPKREYSKS